MAARNIKGMTLHAALQLGQLCHMKKSNGSHSIDDLQHYWMGVDYLFIDEVSMIGCELMADISDALNIAWKGPNATLPFGNLSIIFAGDFCQLPPIGVTKLYTNLDNITSHSADSQMEEGVKKLQGKFLWASIEHVIQLEHSMRQCGSHNEQFRELLNHTQFSNCTKEDIIILNGRLLGSAQVDLTEQEWRQAPIITAQNAMKDALNCITVTSFAALMQREVVYYNARDHRGSTPIQNEELKDWLLNLDSGATKYLLGRLPLVEGMPVIIGENYDINGGIVNGSNGFLKSVQFQEDDDGTCFATSAIVLVPDCSDDHLPHLDCHEVAILAETVDIHKKNPSDGKMVKWKRQQLPLQPGFAITDYKAQGKTFSNVIIDLHSARSAQSAYVMLSCATSLEGLLVLRPFHSNQKKLMGHVSLDFRSDAARLQQLAQNTAQCVATTHKGGSSVHNDGRNLSSVFRFQHTTNFLFSKLLSVLYVSSGSAPGQAFFAWL